MIDRRGAEVLAVVQARASSARLPGKVLLEIGEDVALAMVLDRLARCDQLDGIVLATSVEASDDPVAELARSRGQDVHRGPLDDVLGRYAGAIEGNEAAAAVRITGDCPFVDPGIVDRLVGLWRAGEADYVSNVIEPRSFPKGLDAEVVSRGALLDAAAEASEPAEREHVTTWIRERPDRFPAQGLWMAPSMAEVRVTLDTPEDLTELRRLVVEVGANPSLSELIAALGGPAEPRISERPREAR